MHRNVPAWRLLFSVLANGFTTPSPAPLPAPTARQQEVQLAWQLPPGVDGGLLRLSRKDDFYISSLLLPTGAPRRRHACWLAGTPPQLPVC